MIHNIIPPHEPQKTEPVHPPMIYIDQPVKWEYKQIIRDLEKEQPLDETELNTLGAEGWELTGVTQHQPLAYFYFKRSREK